MNNVIELDKEKYDFICNSMNELIEDAYGYSSSDSVKKNLELWAKNKYKLYEVFKTSPLWNENELCLVLKAKIDRKLNCELFKKMIDCMAENHQIILNNNLNTIMYGVKSLVYLVTSKNFTGIVTQEEIDYVKSTYDSYFSDNNLSDDDDIVKNYNEQNFHNAYRGNYGIAYALLIKYKVREGQKWNKVLNKIFKGESLNIGKVDLFKLKDFEEIKGVRDTVSKDGNIWYIDYFYSFEQFFAVMSDMLTPIEYFETVYISLNPLDYLTQSHGNNWTSCHSLRNKGCYHGATLSMLTDESSIIAYTLPKDAEKNFALIDKLTRQSLFIGENLNVIFQNTFYPSKSMEESAVVRMEIEKIISDYLHLTNKWIKDNSKDDINTRNYYGYKDWQNGQEYYRFHLKESELPYILKIGDVAYCIDNSLKFISDCESLETNPNSCYHCNGSAERYLEYYERWVCEDCLDEYYRWCEDVDDYRHEDDAYYLQDEQRYVSENYDYYYCEETECYYAKATYVENLKGYVNNDTLYNSGDFYQDEDGRWFKKEKVKNEQSY